MEISFIYTTSKRPAIGKCEELDDWLENKRIHI